MRPNKSNFLSVRPVDPAHDPDADVESQGRGDTTQISILGILYTVYERKHFFDKKNDLQKTLN